MYNFFFFNNLNSIVKTTFCENRNTPSIPICISSLRINNVFIFTRDANKI